MKKCLKYWPLVLCLCLSACSGGEGESGSKPASKKLSGSGTSSTSSSAPHKTASVPKPSEPISLPVGPEPNGENITVPDVWPNIVGGIFGGDLSIRLHVPASLTANFCLKTIADGEDCYDNSCVPDQNIEIVGVVFNIFGDTKAQSLLASKTAFNSCLIVESRDNELSLNATTENNTTHVYAYGYRPDALTFDTIRVNSMLFANELNTLEFALKDPASKAVKGENYELTLDVRHQALPGIFDQVILDYPETELGSSLWPVASLLGRFFSASTFPTTLQIKNGISALTLFGYDYQLSSALSNIYVPREFNFIFKQKGTSASSSLLNTSVVKVLVKNNLPSDGYFDSNRIIKQASLSSLFRQKDFCLGGDCND